MLSEGFAAVLRSGRERFNAEFASAKRQYPELDPEAFSSFLTSSVDPLVRAVEKSRPERVTEVVVAAYDVALELVGLGLGGPRARQPWMDALWQKAFPAAAAVVAEAPGRVLAALGNALHQLATTPGARPEAFIETLARLAAQAQEVEVLLKLGHIAAWRAGLAHHRVGALASSDALPETLALAAVGAHAETAWTEVRRELEQDPWFDPEKRERGLRCARIVGGFRGFGGAFSEPPLVVRSNHHFIVQSGEEAWLLTADAFGATLHRARKEELVGTRPTDALPGDARAGQGIVSLRGEQIPAPLLGELTSAAFDARTLALTCSLSHAVVLVAWERA